MSRQGTWDATIRDDDGDLYDVTATALPDGWVELVGDFGTVEVSERRYSDLVRFAAETGESEE